MNIEILDYQPQYAIHFEKINKAWLETYFTMEPIDQYVLENPKEAILDHGGAILFAKSEKGIVGAVALKFVEPNVYELTKMGVDLASRGQGIGNQLCAGALLKAKKMGANKVILYSNRILENAIHIYKKLGFQEVALDTVYKRSDIKMEVNLL
ncbi:MAG TPA: GNAT family N-acetyltransferase [Dyadobacter sp.]|jgi:N-acetylglutamate synthase-like GNAT family acetyltransferase|nr:GNAT family N-acetyltransferase [Dyadobacter sp.]